MLLKNQVLYSGKRSVHYAKYAIQIQKKLLPLWSGVGDIWACRQCTWADRLLPRDRDTINSTCGSCLDSAMIS